MEAIIFTGIQGAGKTTFYLARFAATHRHLSLDLLRTRQREQDFLQECIAGRQSFVVDNTNPAAADRARYIAPARAAGFRIVGYYFALPLALCLARNAARPAGQRVPIPGVRATHKRLQPPTLAEGFDALYIVRQDAYGTLIVEETDDS